MKTNLKSTIICVVFLMLSVLYGYANGYPNTMGETSNNWLQRTSSPGGAIGDENPSDDPGVRSNEDGPVGDGLWLVVAAGTVYCIGLYGKNRKKSGNAIL
jgi:hypothetical protein